MTNIEKFTAEHIGEFEDLLEILAKIPSPSHHEEKRVEFVKNFLEGIGAKGVYVDDAKNVIYPINCEGRDDIVVFMAHTDVVFPDTEELPFRKDEKYFYAPGVGDDTTCLASLLIATKYIIENKAETNRGILIVANSAEEGLGNLKGSKEIMKSFEGRIKEFYTFDGKYPGIVDRCVGSHRYEVICETEGGHSYGAFGKPNAIAELSKLITKLFEVEVPRKEGTKTTYNVGTIEGGTSVNTIAQKAKMLYEYRSDDAECVEIMKNTFEKIVAEANAEGKAKFTVNVVGIRPCSKDYDVALHEKMLESAMKIQEKYSGVPCIRHSGSTDCNTPMSMGVPAVCVGTYRGFGTHTREEYVERASFPISMKITIDVMLQYFNK